MKTYEVRQADFEPGCWQDKINAMNETSALNIAWTVRGNSRLRDVDEFEIREAGTSDWKTFRCGIRFYAEVRK